MTFSRPSQAFSEAFRLELSCPTPGTKILFTTDGSLPAENSAQHYEGPISITESTQVRAVALLEGMSSKGSAAHFYHLAADLAGYQSSLPIMIVDTFGAGPILSKGWNQMGLGIKQVPRRPAAWAIVDRGDVAHASLRTLPQFSSRIGIRQRGSFPPPGYRSPTA